MSNRYAVPANFATRTRTPLLREHFVYRAFDLNGVLLYIGCSVRPALRLKEHRASSRWGHRAVRITLAGPYNYETARLVEYNAIESERSIYNYSSERRALHRIKSDFVSAKLNELIARDVPWQDAVLLASDLADVTFRDYSDEMLTDLSVPDARKRAAA